MRGPLPIAYLERMKWNALEMVWVYADRKILPQSSDSFHELDSVVSFPLNYLEITLKELKVEGLIDGTELGNDNYMVLGITDDGIQKLISSGRLFRLKKHIILHFR